MSFATQQVEQAIQPTLLAVSKPKIGLDTCCVRYYLEGKQPWADLLSSVFTAGISGQVELYVSTVVVSELIANAHFQNRNITGFDPELQLMETLNQHFQILVLDEDIARMAGRLRGSYIPDPSMTKPKLQTQDVLIGATSLRSRHTLFITNDHDLADALPDESCVYLNDMALEWLVNNFPSTCLIPGTITPKTRGQGLPNDASLACIELGSICPGPSAKWDRILAHALNVAVSLNEPIIFFVFTTKVGRRTITDEVLVWHEALDNKRQVARIINHIKKHIEYGINKINGLPIFNTKKHIHVFFFTSLSHARERQTQYNTKTNHQKELNAVKEYLSPLWVFRNVLRLPQVSSLLCENGIPKKLNTDSTIKFINIANNVLGWKDVR